MQPVMIEVSGAEQMGSDHISRSFQPIWFKTRIDQQGPYLRATTCMVAAGQCRTFTHRVDLRPIMRAIAARAKRKEKGNVTVGIRFRPFKGVKKLASKIGKSRLVRKVSTTVKAAGKWSAKAGKAIIKSPITKGVVMAAAIVYPPVGVPAAAALAAANVALAYAEKGKKVGKDIGNAVKKTKLGRKLARGIKRIGKTRARKAFKKSPKLRAMARAAASGKKTLALARKHKKKIIALKRKAEEAKKRFKEIALTAKFSKNPVKRDHARKLARIIKIAAEARAKSKAAAEENSGALPGLFVDKQGHMVKGNFRRVLKKAKTTQEGFVYRPTDTLTRGRFVKSKVSRSKARRLKKVARMAQAKVKLMKKQAEQIDDYKKAKAEAKKAVAFYKKVKRGSAKVSDADKKKARRALRKSKRQGMSTKDRVRLARGLRARLRAKARARRGAVKRTRSNVVRSIKRARGSLKKAKSTASIISRIKRALSFRTAGHIGALPLEDIIAGCSCQDKVGYDCIQVGREGRLSF